MKLFKLEQETYDCTDNAEYVYTSDDGGKTWKGYGWYHLDPHCLLRLAREGYEQWLP